MLGRCHTGNPAQPCSDLVSCMQVFPGSSPGSVKWAHLRMQENQPTLPAVARLLCIFAFYRPSPQSVR